jgi:hypothetical protein
VGLYRGASGGSLVVPRYRTTCSRRHPSATYGSTASRLKSGVRTWTLAAVRASYTDRFPKAGRRNCSNAIVWRHVRDHFLGLTQLSEAAHAAAAAAVAAAVAMMGGVMGAGRGLPPYHII